MYTKKQFGKELKEKVKQRENIIEIGRWVFTLYFDDVEEGDQDFTKILLALSTMELGSEFARSYEKLNKIADDLIAGKNVKL
jgi:hypothetical protein